jgi:two-component system, OmpR family, sensor histidine kinase BaeS
MWLPRGADVIRRASLRRPPRAGGGAPAAGVTSSRRASVILVPSIRWRLTLAFVLVAAVSVGLVATLAVIFANRDLSTLAQQRRTDLIRSLVADAASAYNTGTPNWGDADLQPALVLARYAGAEIAILDQSGQPVQASRPGLNHTTDAQHFPIRVADASVGTLVIRFSDHGIDASARHLQTSLLLAVLAAVSVACLLALAVAAVASRRLTRPIAQLITTVRAVGRGDRSARVGAVDAPGEIRELAGSFDAMADTLAHQEQLRRDLVADIAHELRTPVAILQAGSEAMLDGVTAPSPDALKSLHEEVLRLARLVADLQTLAAADAAALNLTPSATDLGDITAAALDSLAPRFQAAQVDVVRTVQPEALVFGDPDRLRQVVLNLLTNAVKFTPAHGHISVTVAPSDGHVVLTVADSGVGIDAENLPQIFDRFWRGPNAAGLPGTGVGLAIVAGLVHAHRGNISVRSEPGAGTAITVSLPAWTG